VDGWHPSARRAHIWTFTPLTPSGNIRCIYGSDQPYIYAICIVFEMRGHTQLCLYIYAALQLCIHAVCVHMCRSAAVHTLCVYAYVQYAALQLCIHAVCTMHICRVGQNHIYAPHMTVYLVISLPKTPYMYRMYRVLANPTYMQYKALQAVCVLICNMQLCSYAYTLYVYICAICSSAYTRVDLHPYWFLAFPCSLSLVYVVGYSYMNTHEQTHTLFLSFFLTHIDACTRIHTRTIDERCSCKGYQNYAHMRTHTLSSHTNTHTHTHTHTHTNTHTQTHTHTHTRTQVH